MTVVQLDSVSNVRVEADTGTRLATPGGDPDCPQRKPLLADPPLSRNLAPPLVAVRVAIQGGIGKSSHRRSVQQCRLYPEWDGELVVGLAVLVSAAGLSLTGQFPTVVVQVKPIAVCLPLL